jgi:hypothetical protein
MHFSIGNYSACGKVRTKHLATLKNWQINTRGSFVKGLGTRSNAEQPNRRGNEARACVLLAYQNAYPRLADHPAPFSQNRSLS